ncbi:hypothetical protein QCA50_015197 [Cerrena zonata]|uniref:Uncharacterized protein n=1 Tax=Cerrena zonata TaxID=2478898 RepID=A0AAW0FYJ2_9APHY
MRGVYLFISVLAALQASAGLLPGSSYPLECYSACGNSLRLERTCGENNTCICANANPTRSDLEGCLNCEMKSFKQNQTFVDENLDKFDTRCAGMFTKVGSNETSDSESKGDDDGALVLSIISPMSLTALIGGLLVTMTL